MKSIFNQTDNQEIIERINQLSPESKAKWGKMNVTQMLAHCQQPIHVAFGTLKLKRGLLGVLFGKSFKEKMVKYSFKKNLPTHPKFKVVSPEEFQKESNKLKAMVSRFANEGNSVIQNKTHPFFGSMTTDEWDVLHWKHLDHHLSQFGV